MLLFTYANKELESHNLCADTIVIEFAVSAV